MNKQNQQIMYQHFIVFMLSFTAPLVLYLIRHMDNNRLTSWSWALNDGNVFRFTTVLFAVLLGVWLISRFSTLSKGKPLQLFVLSFAAASLFWSEPEVIVDAARYFTQAKHLKVYGTGYFAEQWGKAVFAWTDMPLVPFLYGLVFKLFGEHRVLLQILNTIFYSLTVVLTYQLGKDLWDEETGYNGGLLLLGIPYLYTQVPLLLVDVPTMFFLMLAVVTSYRALKKGGAGRIATACFSLCLVFYAKYSSWMLLTIMPVIFASMLFDKPVQAIRRGGALALSALVLIGILFLFYSDIIMGQLNFLVEYQKPGLKRWSESYVSTFLFQIHPFITVASFVSFVAAIRKMDFRYLIISFLVLLFLILQIQRIRYTLPIFPMLALMAAYGIGTIQNKEIKKQVVLSIAATSFVVAFVGYLPLLKSLGVQNLQEAGKYLNRIPAANIEVVSIAGDNVVVNPDLGVPVLDIYTNKKLYYDKKPIKPEIIERSKNAPLRFTWEFPTPQYYRNLQNSTATEALVVIKDEQDLPLPEIVQNKISSYPVHTFFQQSSKIFRHQTFIAVYHK
jgi:hypothetical protein